MKSGESSSDGSDRITSVDTALRMLLLLQHQPYLRVTTSAQQLGVASSTAHRVLTTLEARRFVTQDRVTRVYRAGPALIELGVGSTGSLDLRTVSEPHLKALVGRLGETVNVVVLEDASIRFVVGFEGGHPVRTHVLTGTLLPAYAASGGKVLLAELPRETLRVMYPNGLRKLTPNTETLTRLMEELSLVMMRGYAVNHGESVVGLSAVAVPLRDHAGRAIAAVAMSAPTGRLNRMDLREIVVQLRDCAQSIRADLAP